MSKRVFSRGRKAALAYLMGTVAALGALAGSNAVAATFSWNGYDWNVDRYPTASYDAGAYFGRDDAIHFVTDTGSGPPSFYDYEGYATLTGLPAGASTFVTGDTYIDSNWQNLSGSDVIRVGIWPVIGPMTGQSYPIVEFYNGGGVGEIRVYDQTDWVYFPAAPINYGGWNTFRVNYIPGGNGAAEIWVNGTLLTTLSPLGDDNYPVPPNPPINPATASEYSIILNSHTNRTDDYDVYWSNVFASLREEYYDAGAIAPVAIVGGEQLLGTYTDRRGLDWDSQKAAWGHIFGGESKFDDSNTTVDANIKGAQLGLDLFALGNPATRAGVTFAYSSQSASVGLPAGGSAGTIAGDSASVGAYLTHADGAFYADLLSQYRFLKYDVTAPISSGKVSGGSIDTTAEAGFHLPSGGGFVLTPMAQLVYEHVMLDDTTLGGMDVTFGNSDALIARARLLAQAHFGGLDVFASAGASTDVLGGTKTTVFGTEFSSTTGGPQAEFTAGVEGKLAPGLSLFGSGEYDISFDGNSQSYAGRAGFRTEF